MNKGFDNMKILIIILKMVIFICILPFAIPTIVGLGLWIMIDDIDGQRVREIPKGISIAEGKFKVSE
jgi:hypothetical protein